MEEDFSKRALAILLVLALIISVLSTFTVINALGKLPTGTGTANHETAMSNTGTSSQAGASVKLSVSHPEEPPSTEASLSLSIKK